MRSVALACVMLALSFGASAHTVKVGTLTLLMCDGVDVRKSKTDPNVLEFMCPNKKEPVLKFAGCVNPKATRDRAGNINVTCGVAK